MTAEYPDGFIRESEESIVELNNSLLELEDDPTNREAMDRIFRTAHTLKGNFAAVGLTDLSQLAHAMEDLLDAIRNGSVDPSPEVMDLVFSGVDRIELAMSQIEDEGDPSVDPDDDIDAIRSVLEGVDRDDGAEAGPPVSKSAAGEGRAESDILDGLDESILSDAPEPIVHVEVDMGDVEMPGVDGMMVLESVTEALSLLGSVPDVETIQAGEYDDGFELYLAGDSVSVVEDELEAIGPIDSVSATDVTADVPRSQGESSPTNESPAEEAVPSDDGGSATGPDIKSVRVDVDQLDTLYNLVEQLVTSRIKLRQTVDDGDTTGAVNNLDELDKITTSLQETVMDMRLVPLRKVVDTFPRMVRDLARSQEKEVNFELHGVDVELDRTILDEISDPLMHVLRNAVDHGIEPPAEREAAGKPTEGTIELRARRERDHVEIKVEDDGGGLDLDAIKRQAVDRGIRTAEELEQMDPREMYDLLFHPGFTTSEEVTDVSGRGVGLDVVRSTVHRLDGSVAIDSNQGEGTTVTLHLPVTMAIVRVLFIEVADREFGVPINSIDEITRATGAKTVRGEEVISHKDELYPIIDLHQKLTDAPPTTNGSGMFLRIREDERKVALHCDAVSRQEEVVIKPFEGELAGVEGLSGTAVIGDGNIVPIIDVNTL